MESMFISTRHVYMAEREDKVLGEAKKGYIFEKSMQIRTRVVCILHVYDQSSSILFHKARKRGACVAYWTPRGRCELDLNTSTVADI